MHDEMQAAEGSNIDETFPRKMIAHHKGAIEMSQVLFDQGSDPQVREMAQKAIAEQTKDIRELVQLLGQKANQ
jgi:uncharacterized protein (DUF305 family)